MPVERTAMLTASQVSALKPKDGKKTARFAVGGQPRLYLNINGNSRAWVFRYMQGGKPVDMGIGSYPKLSLAEARDEAHKLNGRLKAGIDPLKAKREVEQAERDAKAEAERKAAEDAAKAAPITFGELAEVVIANRTHSSRNLKHIQQWRNTIRTYCVELWAKPIEALTREDVLGVIQPIWADKHETASRVRMRIEAVFDHAKAEGYYVAENPATLKLLKSSLKSIKREKEKQPALPYPQLPGFIVALRQHRSISARALELLILTATRTNEALKAKWHEFEGLDGEEPVWRIPKGRMKGGVAHTVPLSPQAVRLLRSLPRVDGNEFVFPGAKYGASLSNMALLQLVRGMNEPEPIYVDDETKRPIVPHGFRSSMRDWSGDMTNYQREVIEASLAHTIANKVEATYRRKTALAKRRELMKDWATYCDGKSNVVSIGKAA